MLLDGLRGLQNVRELTGHIGKKVSNKVHMSVYYICTMVIWTYFCFSFPASINILVFLKLGMLKVVSIGHVGASCNN